MFIGSPYNLKNKVGNEQVMINDKPVARYSSFLCLGVELDERMSWENIDTIDTICRKVGSGIEIIKRVKPFVPSETLQHLYIILSFFHILTIVHLYGITVEVCSKRNYRNYKIGRQEL